MSSEDSDDETAISYGTPLEPYEEDEVPTKKRRDVTEQHALDEHGRRRFHGAFTGGFSAGYGNTVGTLEGWTPRSFKSSRSEKAITGNQRPEDFMDEEDRSEFGIAPRVFQTQNEFSGQKRGRQQKRFYDTAIPGEPVLEQLIRPVHETAAVKMLKAMGWKPGQGIGERVSKKEKRVTKEKQRVYGCYMPEGLRQENNQEVDEELSSDSEFEYQTLFAPDDYEPYILKRKDDRFGLGYSGLSQHSVLGNLVGEYGSQPSRSTSHLFMKDQGKRISIRGQAFGVGALEREDEDIYAREDMSHYDFTIGGPEKPLPKKTPARKASDVLEGFVRSSKPFPSVPSYPPPALPRDYVPAAAGSRRSRFEPTTHQQRDQGLGRHELSAESRGHLLGETPVVKRKTPSPTPITSEDPIAKLLGRNVNFVGTDTASIPQDTPDFIPISSDTSNESANLKTFKPFASNPEKQMRYDKFLRNRGAAVETERDKSMDRLSEWERNRELMEFEQAARLYKPLTGVMGDRFTHGSQPDEGALNPLCAVAKSSNDSSSATKEQKEAVSKGLFGVLTRTESVWRPESLVCKRFNVPDPFVSKPDKKKNEKSLSYSIFDYLEAPVHNKDSFAKEQGTFSGSKSVLSQNQPKTRVESSETPEKTDKISVEEVNKDGVAPIAKRMTVAELFMKESERDLKKDTTESQNTEVITQTIDKFDKMALYKSIFLSDSESDGELPSDNKTTEPTYKDFVDAPKNIERNDSPPRGIFANINFDELNSWNRPEVKKVVIEEKIEETNKELDTQNEKEEVMYGPKLPDNIRNVNQSSGFAKHLDQVPDLRPKFKTKAERELIEVDSSSSSDSWVEMKESKTNKRKKKKGKNKKHKSKHKKSKHKHKKD